MLNQFMDEVVAKGAEAVLPQNLDDQWLDMIYAASKNFIKAVAEVTGGEEKKDYDFSDLYSNLMLTSVTEIMQHQKGYFPDSNTFKIPEDEIHEYILCYAMSIVYESIGRESNLSITPPTLNNIFNRDRLFEIEQENSKLTNLLHKIVFDEDSEYP